MVDEITILSKNEDRLTTISRNTVISVKGNMLEYKVGFGDMILEIFDSAKEAKCGLMKIYNAINNGQRCCSLSFNNEEFSEIDIEKELKEMNEGNFPIEIKRKFD